MDPSPPIEGQDPVALEAAEQPSEHSSADGGPQRLDPRYVPCARLAGGITALVLLLCSLSGWLGYWVVADPSRTRALLVGLALGAGNALVLCLALFWPPLKLRHLTWRLSDFGLEIRRGVVFRHAISVPRARVQHTDVERGPIERRYDLATLVVHTAGHQDSEVRLEGLDHATAQRVRDSLLGGGGHDGA